MVAGAAESGEGVALARGAIERERQERPQLLAQRVLADQLLELGDGLGVVTAVEPQLPQPLDGSHAELVEPGGLGVEGRRACAGVRLPAPEVERGGQPLDGGRAEQPAELVGVHGAFGHRERVSAGMGAQHLRRGAGVAGGLEHPAQAGDVGLQRRLDAGRRVLAPDLVDEVLDRDRPAVGGGEQPDEGPRLGTAEVDDRAVNLDLELSQDPDPHAGDPRVRCARMRCGSADGGDRVPTRLLSGGGGADADETCCDRPQGQHHPGDGEDGRDLGVGEQQRERHR